MKTLIICISTKYGNTEKIAKAMSEVFGADLLKPHEINADDLLKYDLIGFGSGIFYFKHHQALFNLVDRLPYLKKRAFIFSTSGKGSVNQHKAFKDKLSEKGFIVIGEFSCKGFDTWGPYKLIGGRNKNRPNEKDFEDAANFAADLLKIK